MFMEVSEDRLMRITNLWLPTVVVTGKAAEESSLIQGDISEPEVLMPCHSFSPRCLDHQLFCTFIMPREQKRKLCAAKKQSTVKKSEAVATKKKKCASASPPMGAIPHTDSASSSQRPPEGSQRGRSTTKAKDMPNSRSNEGTKCKSKKKHCSQIQHSIEQSPREVLTESARRLVNFIIEAHMMKKPIRKTDMLKIISEKYKKHFSELLVRASFNIEVVFGMELKKVDFTKHSYALVSKMQLPYNGMLSRNGGFPKTGLLMNLLGVIFMKGNSITEEEIWEFLNKMKIYDGKKHFLFGEPRKLITNLVKLKYLEYCQVPHSDPPQYEFLWGPRAYAETSKMKILEFWAKINDTAPSAFQSRYEEALRDEEERVYTAVSLYDSSEETDSEEFLLQEAVPLIVIDDD
ncbi:melanoma-associated antigen B3-like [Cavia porcellus]|uniref:melanoma-associated antigen B3-like n=1 Tax=Cavia porcellus TaxID=10141 RepID=UPI00022B655D|nr:melanoma-associated antigen B3-like [Cavia porcellus]